MTSRLSLDYDKGIFVYHNPEDNTFKEVDGLLQVIVGIDPSHHSLNALPFLPIRLGAEGKTFRASCKKCLTDRKKSLCRHNILQRRWRETYNCRELAYAVTRLNYKLFCIEEGLIYDQLEPIFANFMQMMASKKIRSSKIPPSYQSDLQKYCDEINSVMKFSRAEDILTPELLVPNEYECSFIKGVMNIVVSVVRNEL